MFHTWFQVGSKAYKTKRNGTHESGSPVSFGEQSLHKDQVKKSEILEQYDNLALPFLGSNPHTKIK